LTHQPEEDNKAKHELKDKLRRAEIQARSAKSELEDTQRRKVSAEEKLEELRKEKNKLEEELDKVELHYGIDHDHTSFP